ncbi:hypothetical protein ACOKM3_00500 [Streptomyces sp. BH106]|uniref:hypothetical protein n=1 Tax=Streptomyces sp. BH106 TaxID=3410409 RepID=UPI003CFAD4A5
MADDLMSDEEPQRTRKLGVEMRQVSLDDGSVMTIVCDAGLSEADVRSRATRIAEDNRRQ